jgi:hypothetical protein
MKPTSQVGASGIVKGDGYILVGNFDTGVFNRIPIDSDGKLDGTVSRLTISAGATASTFKTTDDLILFDDEHLLVVTFYSLLLVKSTDDF